ncbi:MAG: HD domain-containing protein [Lachnospiraceae bacterium]|nr:HD domain-containing protein [Lachnospiraceae bacterium]
MKSFASIYIGSYEIVCKVYELSKEKTIKEIDCIRTWCNIAHDIGQCGQITTATLNDILSALKDMRDTVKMYKVDGYRVYAGYTLETAKNAFFVMDQIKIKVGFLARFLSNSEQRFLTYQAIASMPDFEKVISKSALLVDIGGSSLQVTYFKNGQIVTTEHILLGAFPIRDIFERLKDKKDSYGQTMEIIHKEISTFFNMYMKGDEVSYLILVNDQLHNVVERLPIEVTDGVVPAESYHKMIEKVKQKKLYSVISEQTIYDENDDMIMPFILLYQGIIDALPAKKIMIPGVAITEGIAYDYAFEKGLMKPSHDFEEDVVSACWAIARRYGSYIPHLKALDKMSQQIFDAMKKHHGMPKRDRLIVRCAAILHDCGKYISLSDESRCSYSIIMASEILGLTHKERLMVAYIAAANRQDMPPYEEISGEFTKPEYIEMQKLVAILRVANALDRSHKQKLKKVKMQVRDDILNISLEAEGSISMEKGMFEDKASFFESVHAIRPVIKEKKL